MLVDSLTLLDGSVVHNATVESGASLPATGDSTLGGLFYLTSGSVGLYLYNGTAWTQFESNTASPVFTGRTQSDAYSYTVSALGSISGSHTLDLAAAGEFTMTLTASTTFVFTNTLTTGRSEVVYLRITNGGASGVTVTWPASTKFAAGTAPTLTASGTDLLGVKYDTTTSTYMVFVIGLAIA